MGSLRFLENQARRYPTSAGSSTQMKHGDARVDPPIRTLSLSRRAERTESTLHSSAPRIRDRAHRVQARMRRPFARQRISQRRLAKPRLVSGCLGLPLGCLLPASLPLAPHEEAAQVCYGLSPQHTSPLGMCDRTDGHGRPSKFGVVPDLHHNSHALHLGRECLPRLKHSILTVRRGALGGLFRPRTEVCWTAASNSAEGRMRKAAFPSTG